MIEKWGSYFSRFLTDPVRRLDPGTDLVACLETGGTPPVRGATASPPPLPWGTPPRATEYSLSGSGFPVAAADARRFTPSRAKAAAFSLPRGPYRPRAPAAPAPLPRAPRPRAPWPPWSLSRYGHRKPFRDQRFGTSQKSALIVSFPPERSAPLRGALGADFFEALKCRDPRYQALR